MTIKYALFAAAVAAQKTYYPNGQFQLTFDSSSCGVQIALQSNPNEPLWSSTDNILQFGEGNVDQISIMEAGNVANFPQVTSTLSGSAVGCDLFTDYLNEIFYLGGYIPLQDDPTDRKSFIVTFGFDSADKVKIEAFAGEATGDWISLNFESSTDEEIYGMGLQPTVWNFKGEQVPLIVDEGGVGRGEQPLTREMDAAQKGSGGTTMTSYGPAVSYVTNKGRGFMFDNLQIGIADFSESDNTQILYWHAKQISGHLLVGQDFMAQAQNLSRHIGTMTPLPSWVMEGSIIGIVNGQDYVWEKYNKMKELGLPMVGIWMQDWVGEHQFPEGVRLLWNWQLNLDWYPEWDQMVDSWAQDGCRPFIYINPYVADLTSFDVNLRQNQFQIGQENNYFVKNQQGEDYLIQSISIQFAMVDFTNPDARAWWKSIIIENLVNEGRGAGWMHDFGEYLPFDAVLSSGVDPMEYHNQYAEDWAAVVHEALQTVSGGEDIVYFMRAATARSPKKTRLFWMGDQNTSFDAYDGMQSAMVDLMNSGLSGFGIGHSDIGGYTVVDEPLVQKVTRSKELLWRWIEMSTFSDMIMRSHPSSSPDKSFQIWDDDETILHMKKFTEIHIALADYKMFLMDQHFSHGSPVTRPLMLNFPENQAVRSVHNQFMLGENVLMAPAFADGVATLSVILPGPTTWTHMWDNTTYEVTGDSLTVQVDASQGRPAVFYRDTPAYTISTVLSQF